MAEQVPEGEQGPEDEQGPEAPGGSYRPAEMAGGLEQELSRLDLQARLSWAQEARVLHELGLRDGMSVLDAGCGSGAVTALLRSQFPASRLSGLDNDPQLLAVARRRFVPGQVRLHQGDLTDPRALAACGAPFDAVLARFVFQHLAHPVAAAATLRGALVPGGLLAVCDVDAVLWGAAVPDVEQFSAEAYRRLGAVQAADGGDRLIVRRLPRILAAAGFTDVVVRPYAYTSDEVGLDALAPQVSPERLRPLVARGALTLAEYRQAFTAWQRFRRLGGFVLLLGFVVAGRAPA